jgi:hypothetical protein
MAQINHTKKLHDSANPANAEECMDHAQTPDAQTPKRPTAMNPERLPELR